MLNESMSSQQSVPLVCCEVGGESYVFDMAVVRSVQRTDLLQRNPGKDGPLGWLLGARTELPVFDMSYLLGRPAHSNDDANGRIIVVDDQAEPWGLLVDRVSRVVVATRDEFYPLPEAAQNPSARFFKGLVKFGDRLMLYVSPDRLHPNAPRIVEELELQHVEEAPVRERTIKEADPSIRKRVLIFSTGSRDRNGRAVSFGLSLNQVLQIMDAAQPVPVPSQPLHSLGVVQWRDRTIPVVDLDEWVGFEKSTDPHDRLLVARASSQSALVGLLIRPSITLQGLPMKHSACNHDVGVNPRFTRGIFTLEDRTLVVPDLDAILATNEYQPLPEMALVDPAPVH